jgi:hypothetical protein
MFARYGAAVKIYTSTFESNSAGNIINQQSNVRSSEAVLRIFAEFSSLQFPAGNMELLGRSNLCQ